MSEQTSHRYLILELLAILGLFVFSAIVSASLSVAGGPRPPLGDPRYLARVTFTDFAACVLFAVLILLRGQKPDVAGLCTRATSWLPELALGVSLFAGFLGYAWFAGGLSSFPPAWTTFQKSMPIGTQVLFFIHITVNALYQELLFRGYLLSRLELIASPAKAVLIGAILFALAHAGQPPMTLLFMFGCGMAFGIIFFFHRNLTKLVIAHALYNIFMTVSTGIKTI